MLKQGLAQDLVQIIGKRWLACIVGCLLACTHLAGAQGQALPRFDFTLDAQGWQPQHDISRIEAQKDGLHIAISKDDPYMVGPVRDYPADVELWARLRLKSDQGGTGQIFYFAETGGPSEERSVKFAVRPGIMEEVKVPLPALGPRYRLRFDPPGTGGNCTLALLAIEPRPKTTMPPLVRPNPLELGNDSHFIQSGLLSLTHAHHQLGGFVVSVGDQPMAIGYTRPMVGYRLPTSGGQPGQERWADISKSAIMMATKDGEEIIVRATCHDPDGATWYLHRSFRPGPSGSIHVLTTVQVDRDREILLLPMFIMLPGVAPATMPTRSANGQDGARTGEGGSRIAGIRPGFASAGVADRTTSVAGVLPAPSSFGKGKTQALFAGSEYLDRDELSSSEADIQGPGASRQTPDSLKITFPLMAIQSGGNYIGLIWDHPRDFTALFDSPDRTLNGGGHVMGVLFPGSDGNNRREGSLVPYEGALLKANKPLVLSATLIGGRGADVVPAIQQYVALRGLPPIPKTIKWQEYAGLALDGFLNSGIRSGSHYRHAYPNFGESAVADVPMYLDWLTQQPGNSLLKARAGDAARAALAEVRPDDLNYAGIGHVRYPAPALLYGHVEESVERARRTAESLLGRFDKQNRVVYVAPAKGNDLGKTHFAPDANGMTAQVVTTLLENALLSGDRRLIAAGIAKLRTLDRFAHTVPRGAQTWEVPLHTPDILASAYLLRAYTLGYEITGEPGMLEQAEYWAWTGVPFVYLVNPTELPVGTYATIAVYGATQWVAPNWMGLPVQWCGLVYADALYRLAKYDTNGPWEQIANGITASGVQQTWPHGSDSARQGLLPDSFNLRTQTRNDAAINPGTLLVDAQRLFNRPALFDFQTFQHAGVYVFAPGDIDNATYNGKLLIDMPEPVRPRVKPNTRGFVKHKDEVVDAIHRMGFTVHGWSARPYSVLLNGLQGVPSVTVNRQSVSLTGPNRYDAASGRLILQVQGTARIEISE